MNVRPGLLAVLLGSLVSAAAAAVAMAASGSNGGPVVLLGTAEDEPLTGRIAAELRALGIPIEIRVVAGEEPGIELEVEEALRGGARAAVRIDAQTGRTEVSIADPASHRVALKQALEGPPTAALAPVLAVRTVEFVRATLLGPRNEEGLAGATESRQLGRDGSTTDGELTGSPAGDRGGGEPISGQAFLRLSAVSGALFTPGGLSSAFTAGLVGRLRLSPRIGVEAMGFAPLTQGRVVDGQLTTRAHSWLAGAGLLLREAVSNRIAVEVAAGATLAVVASNGTVQVPSNVSGQSAPAKVAAATYGRVGADLALSRTLALRLDLLGGVAFNRVVVDETTFLSNKPVAWPRVFAAALGGVEARWF